MNRGKTVRFLAAMLCIMVLFTNMDITGIAYTAGQMQSTGTEVDGQLFRINVDS